MSAVRRRRKSRITHKSVGLQQPIKIAIVGAGIGGLVAAHQLVKLNRLNDQPLVQIDVYESTNHIGGMARSSRDAVNGCPTEYSWRVYFWFYQNLFSILREIPLDPGQSKSKLKSVYDLLSNKGGSEFMYKDNQENHVNFSKDFVSKMRFGLQILGFSTTCDKKAKTLDKITWNEYKKQNGLIAADREQEWEPTPQVLGLDKFKASPYSVMKIGIESLIFAPFGSHNRVMTGPTSEVWFDPWFHYLKSLGVRFHFNHHLKKLRFNTHDNSMASTAVFLNEAQQKQQQQQFTSRTADHFLLDLPVEQLAVLIHNSPNLQQEPQFRNQKMDRLAKKSAKLQLCFQAHFTQPVFLSDPNSNTSGFILLNSPWALIIETREMLFPNPICAKNNEIRGSWSILAGQDGVPGILFGKPFSLCTEQEIHLELWAQILQNNDVMNAAKKWNNHLDLASIQPIWSPMWPSFHYDRYGHLSTIEPKFSNNAGTLKLRPSCKLKTVNNVHLCAAFTKEALDIFSMEGATISGMTAAESVRDSLLQHSRKTYLGPFPPYPRPWFFRPFRSLDCWLRN